MKNFIRIGIGLFTATLFSCVATADQTTQLTQLMSYFGSNCPSQGEWTQAALGQAQALVSVFQSIQTDPDCQTVSGALGNLQTLNTQIQRMSSLTNQSQIVSLKAQEQELLLQYSQETDPTMLATIKTSLYSTEVSLAAAQGNATADQTVQAQNEASALTSVVQSTNTVMSQALANQACLVNHPSILAGIASLTSSVAAGMATSGISLGIAAGTQLLDSVVEYIRQQKLAGEISTLSQGIAETAYQCVLESLSDSWCSAQDALGVINLKAQSLTAPEPSDAVWEGAALLDRQLPVFLNWLNEVRAGSDPTDDAEAARQEREFERESQVKTDRAFGLGIVSENTTLFAAATTDQARWVIERAAITQFAAELTKDAAVAAADGSTNPLLDIYDPTYAPFYLIGLTLDQAPRTQGAICPLASFNPFQTADAATNPCGWPAGAPPFVPSLNQLEANLTSWVTQAEAEVDAELGVVLQSDPLQVMTDAVTVNVQGQSPQKSIQAFIQFLTAQRGFAGNAAQALPIYDDTIAKLNEILADITSGITATPAAQEAIVDVYSTANLSDGTVLFNNRMTWAIRLSLNALLLDGTGIPKDTDAALLAADDVITELESYSGSSNLTAIAADVKQSQLITEQTLTGFGQVFGKGINDILTAYSQPASSSGDGDPQAGKDALAQMCLKLLAVPTWPTDVSRNLCVGAKLSSIFQNGPSSITIAQADFTAPLEQRACHYRNYLRDSQIYQDYLQNPPGN